MPPLVSKLLTRQSRQLLSRQQNRQKTKSTARQFPKPLRRKLPCLKNLRKKVRRILGFFGVGIFLEKFDIGFFETKIMLIFVDLGHKSIEKALKKGSIYFLLISRNIVVLIFTHFCHFLSFIYSGNIFCQFLSNLLTFWDIFFLLFGIILSTFVKLSVIKKINLIRVFLHFCSVNFTKFLIHFCLFFKYWKIYISVFLKFFQKFEKKKEIFFGEIFFV